MKRYLLLLILLWIALHGKISYVAQKACDCCSSACAAVYNIIIKCESFIKEWKTHGYDVSQSLTYDALPFWTVAVVGVLILVFTLRVVLMLCCKFCEDERKSTGDEPIESSRDDKLGRLAYVRSLCKIVKTWSEVDSQVVGIYGEWGEGKTSVINLFDEQYCRGGRREFDLVRFCPWHSVDRKNLSSELFSSIGLRFGFFCNPDLSLKFMIYAQKTTAHFMLGVGSLSELAFSVLTWILSSFSSRDYLKKCICAKLHRRKRRLIVVLDDVDRLSKDEVLELVRCLKTNAYFPNTTYFLLSDEKRLADMIKSEVDSAEKGCRYLEKIVQCPYPLWPVGAEILRGEAISLLNNVLKVYNSPVFDDMVAALDFCLEKTKNLRQIKRVVYAFNESLAYYYSMIDEEAYSTPLNIELGDALRLAALRIIEPGCTEKVYRFYEKYINMWSTFGEIKYMVNRDEYERLCESVSVENKVWFKTFLTEAMLLEEVPSEKAIIAEGIKDDADYAGFRIASPRSFRRYFNSAEIPRGLIPRHDRLELLIGIQNEEAIEKATTTLHEKYRLFYILEAILVNKDYVGVDEGDLSFVRAADYIVRNLDAFEAYEESARYRLTYDACQLAVDNIVRLVRMRSLSPEKEGDIADWIIVKKFYVLGLFVLHFCAGQLEPTVVYHIDMINGAMADKIWQWVKKDLSCKIFSPNIEERKDGTLIQKLYMMILLEKVPVDSSIFRDNCNYFIASMDSPMFAKRLNSLVTYRWSVLIDGASKTRRDLIGSHKQFFMDALTAAEKYVLKNLDGVSIEDLNFIKEMGYGYQTVTSFEMSKLFKKRLGGK